ncbi:MAG TPA: fibronectin type III domain-containing protein [Candidatus Polarisedimenticolaceae bacterium]|nr:fibronectin type III domain-containing protein [Candidatus Polarisedimenticolaceae bacterium]
MNPPGAPTGLQASASSSSSINLAWSDTSGESGFRIERRLEGTNPFAEIGATDADETTFVDEGLSPSTAYDYRVRGVNGNGFSGYSSVATATTEAPPLVPPAAPTSLSGGARSSTTVHLTWVDNADNETAFEVERGTTSFANIAVLSADTTSFDDTGLTPSTSYLYRVRATNGAGPSAYTPSAFITTDPPPLQPPTAPSGLAVVGKSSTTIDVSWVDNADSETAYEVERAPGGTTSFVNIASLPANGVSYHDTGLTPSTAYAYRVRATNGAGPSSYSASVQATTDPPLQPPAAPSNLSATSTTTQISLSWVDNANNETSYVVDRAPGGTSGFVPIATLGANAQQYTNSPLSSMTSYSYRVRAVNAAGSAASGTVTRSTLVSFASNVRSIVIANACSGCHNGTMRDLPPTSTNEGGLSFNADPDLDLDIYSEITNDDGVEARSRVNLPSPASSLILTKPTGVSHSGGTIWTTASTQYQTILKWIQEGAQDN